MNNEFMKIGKITENKAREMLEHIRWSNGIICPKCGSDKGAYKLKSKPETKTRCAPDCISARLVLKSLLSQWGQSLRTATFLYRNG